MNIKRNIRIYIFTTYLEKEGWWGNLMERDHLKDPGVEGKIKLKWIFEKWDGRAWTGSIWLMIGTDGGFL
jgi:hypothetical protein